MTDALPANEDLNLRHLIEDRAQDDAVRNRPFLRVGSDIWSYAAYRDEAVRIAHLLRRRLDARRKPTGRVATLLDNVPEMPLLLGACGIADLTLFPLNTGLRGAPLAGLLNQSGARVLVVEERFAERIAAIEPTLTHLDAENILYVSTPGSRPTSRTTLAACLDSEVGPADRSLPMPDANPRFNSPLCVIYTSGTTGLPRGINNTHQKVIFAGFGVGTIVQATADDVGYAATPLFHSSSLFNGLMVAFWATASIVLRRRFSASAFVPDVLEHGVTWWNYVGEPVHYVLEAIARQFDGDEDRIRAEVTNHPNNRLRYAFGNGASPPDIDRFTRWLGLHDMFEHYGATEGAIAVIRTKHDPRGSVGEVVDPAVQILDQAQQPCPAALLDGAGRVVNYKASVGEICKVSTDVGMFQGYFDDEAATNEIYRDGVFHSGDLGHVVVHGGKRFLYFDGRTADWIRKDGENFSGLQVSRLMATHSGVALAAAYGAPCPVSDELVMASLLPKQGASLSPAELFDFCRRQIERGDMDEKWMPDFIRIVEDFEFTTTRKIVVEPLKKTHYHPDRTTDPIYWRERDDTSYRPFTRADFDRLQRAFEAAERAPLLEP